MFVYVVVCSVGSGPCDELIPRSEECYRMWACLIVCYLDDLETSTMKLPRLVLACCGTETRRDNPFCYEVSSPEIYIFFSP